MDLPEEHMMALFSALGVEYAPKNTWNSPRGSPPKLISQMSDRHLVNSIALSYRRLSGRYRVWPNPLKGTPGLANMIITAHERGIQIPAILVGTNWPWGDRSAVYAHSISQAVEYLPGYSDRIFSVGAPETGSLAAMMRSNARRNKQDVDSEFRREGHMDEQKQSFMDTFTETAKLGLENAQNGVIYGAALAAVQDAIKDYRIFLPDWITDEKTLAAAIWFFGTTGYSALEQVEAEVPFMGLLKTLLRGAGLGAAAHFGIEGGAMVYDLVKKVVAYVNVYLRKDGLEIDMDGNIKPASQIEDHGELKAELDEMKSMIRSLVDSKDHGTVSLKAVQ